ncbi:ornithine carbamoyltransferase [bacterium]|nr:MAG: ornithine carbamoyltransferase [bacterium]
MGILAQALGVKAPELTAHSPKSKPQSEVYGDVLSIDDLTDTQLGDLLELAAADKLRRRHAPAAITAIEGRSVAMVFEKQSLRTRVSFETAIRELGGHPIYLTKGDIGIGSREAMQDVSGNLSRWVALIVARLYWQRDIQLMADVATVPVVNALTEWEHPCQALADLLTIREEFEGEPVKIAYVGDGNNVARSLAKLGTRLGHPVTLVGPKNFQLEDIPGLTQTEDIEEGLVGAKVVYTDVWVSMGDEREQEQRLKTFNPYQVDERMMSIADKDAIFLHCLPARRGLEVTDGVIDGRQSRIHDQAENRLHAQKALLRRILGL